MFREETLQDKKISHSPSIEAKIRSNDQNRPTFKESMEGEKRHNRSTMVFKGASVQGVQPPPLPLGRRRARENATHFITRNNKLRVIVRISPGNHP